MLYSVGKKLKKLSSNMEYVDQSVDSIRLYVGTGSPNISQFKILKEVVFEISNTTINFGILGTSHYVKVSNQDKSLTEICACVEGEFTPEDNLIVEKNLHDLANGEFTSQAHGYTFRSTILRGKEVSGKVARLQQLRSKKDTQYLELAFRGKYFFSKKPMTEIYVTHSHNQIAVQTIHTYPNERSAVFTESIFTFEST